MCNKKTVVNVFDTIRCAHAINHIDGRSVAAPGAKIYGKVMSYLIEISVEEIQMCNKKIVVNVFDTIRSAHAINHIDGRSEAAPGAKKYGKVMRYLTWEI